MCIRDRIDTEPSPDRRERLIRERYGEDYARIRKEIYPKLRAVELRYYLQRVGMTQDLSLIHIYVGFVDFSGIKNFNDDNPNSRYVIL